MHYLKTSVAAAALSFAPVVLMALLGREQAATNHLGVASLFMMLVIKICLQCFDTVAWAAGRASGP